MSKTEPKRKAETSGKRSKPETVEVQEAVDVWSVNYTVTVKPERVGKKRPRPPFDVELWVQFETIRGGLPRIVKTNVTLLDPDATLTVDAFAQIGDAVERLVNQDYAAAWGSWELTRQFSKSPESDAELLEKLATFLGTYREAQNRVASVKRSRALTPEYLRQVARVVKEEEARHPQNPKIRHAVVRELNLSSTRTARNHIEKAREAGLLPKADRGVRNG